MNLFGLQITRTPAPAPVPEKKSLSSLAAAWLRGDDTDIASDETLDRYEEVIMASGWNLKNYQRNPVIQNAHQYGDILFTIGKALSTEVRSGKLTQRVQFACDVNPFARVAYGLYKGKFLNAVSVGFVPVRWENGTEKTTYRRKFLEQELLEVSAVAIPANPNALALGLKSGAVEKSDLRDTADLIYYALDRSASAGLSPSPGGEGQDEGGISLSHSPAHLLTHSYLPGSTLNHQLLLQTARQLRDILKHT